MPIDERILEKIKEELGKKIKNRKCESCGEQSWILMNYFLAFPVSKIPGTFQGERQLPEVAMICSNCGYSRFYNLEILGIYSEILKEIEDIKKEKTKEDKL